MKIININNITTKKYKFLNKIEQKNEINKKEQIKQMIKEGKYKINIERTTEAMIKWLLRV